MEHEEVEAMEQEPVDVAAWRAAERTRLLAARTAVGL